MAKRTLMAGSMLTFLATCFACQHDSDENRKSESPMLVDRTPELKERVARLEEKVEKLSQTLQILAKGSGQTLERLREMTLTGMIMKRDEMIERAFREDPEGMESMITRMRDAIMNPKAGTNERS